MRRRLYTYTVYLAYIYVQSGHHYESFSLLLSLSVLSSFIIRQTFIQVRYIYVCVFVYIYIYIEIMLSFRFCFYFYFYYIAIFAACLILYTTILRCVVVVVFVALSRFVDIDKKFIILTWFTCCCCCFFLFISLLLLLLFLFRCCFLILFYPKLRYLSIFVSI